MHTYLVIGMGKERRDLEIRRLIDSYKIPPISLISLTPPHTISTIREIRRRLTLSPVSDKQAIIVEDAHELNVPSQNAFLKTLEEPPKNTIIILSSKSEDALLPTIRSRCILLITPISPITPNLEEQKELFEKLRKARIGERIAFIDNTGKTRDGAIYFVEGQLQFLHYHLKNTPDVGRLKRSGSQNSSGVKRIGKALLQALFDLRHNVNPKMSLFELLKNY